MNPFSDREVDYLRNHHLGHISTTGRMARPHVVPIVYHLDGDGVFRVGQHPFEGHGKDCLNVRHLQENPRAAIVVDDVDTSGGLTASWILVKGDARLHDSDGEGLDPGLGPPWLELVPDYASSWGINTPPFEPPSPPML